MIRDAGFVDIEVGSMIDVFSGIGPRVGRRRVRHSWHSPLRGKTLGREPSSFALTRAFRLWKAAGRSTHVWLPPPGVVP